MDATEENEMQRMQRHLRAMSAVNRSLHAQLEGTLGAGIGSTGIRDGDLLATTDVRRSPLALRRASTASAWVQQLQLTSGGGEAFLARGPNGAVFVVEGRYRREVSSGLLAAALSENLGEPREMNDGDLERLDEGVPVEVLEGPSGRPFVIVAGRRISLRGLPLPHPVSSEQMQLFPAGEEVNVAAANVARARFEQAFSGRYQIERARAAVGRKGVVPTAGALARRVLRRFGSGSRR